MVFKPCPECGKHNCHNKLKCAECGVTVCDLRYIDHKLIKVMMPALITCVHIHVVLFEYWGCS